MLVNPELGGVTLGWNLVHTAQDELFAAIEGTAFHTRIILERMAEHGVRIDRVINAGGIPQKNEVLNQVYANVLNKPVLVPAGIPTSLGSGIFALLAAGAYKTIEEAQAAVCLPLRTVEPDRKAAAVYEQLYRHYRDVYFAFGLATLRRLRWEGCCRSLRKIAAEARKAGLGDVLSHSSDKNSLQALSTPGMRDTTNEVKQGEIRLALGAERFTVGN